MDHIRTGDVGEQAAAEFLQKAGYKILARNYRVKPGEIDIVARQRDTLVFVEVKTRRGDGYGTPAEAVTPRKQERLIAAALCYLRQTGADDVPFRMDVIEVRLDPGGRPKLNHIVNAFGR